ELTPEAVGVPWLPGPALDCGSDPTSISCSSFGTHCPPAAFQRILTRRHYGLRAEACAFGRALDCGAVGGGPLGQQANPRQRDIEGAKPPASRPPWRRAWPTTGRSSPSPWPSDSGAPDKEASPVRRVR